MKTVERFSVQAALIAILAVAFSLAPASSAMAYSFSSDGVDDALSAASTYRTRCSGLTKNELAAMILAVTWPEASGGSTTKTPSPMTLGRSDTSTPLYSYNNTTSYPRAFWHAGVGAWQLDSAGLGSNYGAYHRVSTYTSAQVAGDWISSRFCSSTGTEAQRRKSAWYPTWYACSGSTCETVFQGIYSTSTDALLVTRNSSVPRWGGMLQRDCRLGGYPYYQNVTCYFIDPDLAKGDVTWRASGYGPSPITEGFYAHSNTSSGAAGGSSSYYRHWLAENTGYSQYIYGIRSKGGNARSTSAKTWYTGNVLCDLQSGRGC